MRVIILANMDPTSSLVFEELCMSKKFTVVGIGFTSTLTTKKTYWTGLIDIFKRSGKRYFGYMCFWNGVFLLKEKFFNILPFSEKGFGSSFFSLRNYSRNKNIEVTDTNNFNSLEFIEKVRKWNPDVIVTRINQILKKPLLELPKHGCLCCHSSLLPSYQGIAAEFYNLLNEEKFAGFTIFRMTENLDKGNVLLQRELRISEDDTVYSLTRRNAKLGGKLLIETLSKIKNGDLTPKQQVSGGRYYSWPDAKAVAEFKAKKKKFIKLSEIISHIIC